MNYYDHHIRDYDAATAHLSWDEDMAYSRLLRWYYRKEKPIPADLPEACRQVRATSKIQRDAVKAVLEEFFELREDGWHQDKCDDAIATYHAREPEREAKKKNEDTRLARHRAERTELFGIINAAGVHRSWNAPISELRELVAQLQGRQPETQSTNPATQTHEPATRPATAPATPATDLPRLPMGTCTPVPTPHSPLPNISSLPEPVVGGNGEAPESPDDDPPPLLEPEDPDPPGVPPCDHQAVLKLWAQLCQSNPQPKRWTPARQGHLRARWRELFAEGKATTRDEALAWFAKYFRWIAQSRFLTGRAGGTNGKPPFEARLDWVLVPDNLAKVIEGEYHRED